MHKIEPLEKSHDRDGFDCGSEPLNLFLKQTARQHAERGISRTFVLVDENAAAPKPVIGFFALNLCQVKSEMLSPEQAKKLPRDVSAVRLGRLARAKEFKGQGVGEILLIAAMEKFIEIFKIAGGIGLFVDAKDQKAKEFYEKFGFVSLPSNEFELFLPVKTIQDALTQKS
ncbi:MAG TPA: GNAT family N-acetyltransferase [Verrucomicrobiae bacterium]|nr:GNAT family N-acetyltransferase [Verrucomicrobiae bacterium]